MWTIKFLNGPLTGQAIELKSSQVIGRDPSCDIFIEDRGISKKHAEIRVETNGIFIKDLGSSNGTFVNGIRIKHQELKMGDKIGFYTIIAEFGIGQKSIVLLNKKNSSLTPSQERSPQKASLRSPSPQATHTPQPMWISSENLSSNATHEFFSGKTSPESQGRPKAPFRPDSLVESTLKIVEEKIIPDVVSISDRVSYKGFFIVVASIFVILVSVLSVIPMYLITEESVKQESQLRAISMGRAIASVNEERLRTQEYTQFSTALMYKEPGIEDVYIIGPDGVILAPAERAGTLPKHIEFARKVRSKPREFVTENRGIVLAAVPIVAFDQEQQINVAKGHVVVAYQPRVLKFQDERLFGLLIQVLLIGFICGGLLFYILYKVVEYVFRELYKKLDEAIKAGANQIEVPRKFPLFQELVTLINTILSRSQQSQSDQSISGQLERVFQLRNICDLIPYPCLMVNQEGVIEHVNDAFRSAIEIGSGLSGKPTIYQIPDQAIQKNFAFILEQALNQSQQIVQDEIEIGGNLFVVSGQSFSAQDSKPDLCLIRIAPKEAA